MRPYTEVISDQCRDDNQKRNSRFRELKVLSYNAESGNSDFGLFRPRDGVLVFQIILSHAEFKVLGWEEEGN